MSDLDERLNAALGADAPPARDPLFRVDLLGRIERARFRRQMTLVAALSAVVAVVVALNAPALNEWLAGDVRRLALVAFGLAAASFALPGITVASVPGVRTLVSAVGRWLYP